MAISVFLVDDHAVVRQGIRSILEADPTFTIVGEAGDGLEAVRLVERLRPDLLILDVMMPGLNGLDTLRIIRRRSPETRILMISMYETVAFVAEALRGGAMGYVLKGGQSAEIRDAAHAVMAGRRYLSPPLSEVTIQQHLATLDSASADPHDLLTPRELQVLQLAAEGLTCPQIGARLSISERTAERHRANLMRKLDLHSQTDLVLYVVRRGRVGADTR